MSKNKNKNVSPVVVSSVPVVVEEAVASLSDVLGEVSETSLETVSETVLSEVLSEEVPSTVSLVPEVQETVSVEVPNVFLSKFQSWLTNTTTRAANGGLTSNGKRLGRKPSIFTKTLSLVKLPKAPYFVPSKRGRPTVGSILTSITVSKDLVYTPETQFEVDLLTNDWKIVAIDSEVRKAA